MLGLNNKRTSSINKSLFMFHLFRLKKSSISEISRLMDLSIPAISRIAKELADEGLVIFEESNTKANLRGNNAGQLKLATTNDLVICIDVRPTGLYSILTDRLGQIQTQLHLSSLVLISKESLLEMLEREIRYYQKLYPQSKLNVALAFHGQVDQINGISLMMPQAPWHEPFYVKFLLEQDMGLEVQIDNDCVMRALGQKWYLLRKKPDIPDFAVINLDYGIGSSFLINGQIYRGPLFGSGQIGHTIIDPNGRLCSCGRYGCLETLASIEAIHKNVAYSLQSIGKNTATLKFEDIVNMYREGNEVVRSQVNRSALSVGQAIYNFLNVLNINHIFLYGRTCQFGDEFLEVIKRTVLSNPFDQQQQLKQIATSIEYGTLSYEEQIAGISYLFSPIATSNYRQDLAFAKFVD